MTNVRLAQGSAVGLLLISHVTSDDFQSKYQESNDGLVDCSTDSVNQRLKSTFASSFCIWWSNCSWGWPKLYQLPKNRHDSIIWYHTFQYFSNIHPASIRMQQMLRNLTPQPSDIHVLNLQGTNHNSHTRCSHSRSVSCAVHAPHAPSSLVPSSLQELSWANVVRGQDLAQNSVQRWLQCRCEQLVFWIFAGCQWVSSRIHAGWFVLESRDLNFQQMLIDPSHGKLYLAWTKWNKKRTCLLYGLRFLNWALYEYYPCEAG